MHQVFIYLIIRHDTTVLGQHPNTLTNEEQKREKLYEVTRRMEHSRYFFSLQMETLPFSYIWFKSDILSNGWCKLHSVMVIVPNY